MAKTKDPQTKKRKASVPEVEAEKVKKVKSDVAKPAEAPAKKRKATDDPTPAQSKKSKTPTPILQGSSELTPAEPSKKNPTTVKSKNVKKENTKQDNVKQDKVKQDKVKQDKVEQDNIKNENVKKENVKKDNVKKESKKAGGSEPVKNAASHKPSKVTTLSAEKNPPSKDAKSKPEIGGDADLDSGLEDEDKNMDEDSDSEVDDQTLALLQGLESDGDEEEATGEGYTTGDPIPVREKLSKKEEKRLKKIAESAASDKPGVVYIGRVPHGFYEHEMKAYFKQFGNILKIRLSRNKKTGASKHFGFIQFESATVADIVARTMDNYLMFNHLLKVKLIPDEQVNPDWFKGANKRFKKVPWNRMAGRKLEQGKSEESWNGQVAREEKRRSEKADKMKEIGYEFDAPKVKSATGVAKPNAVTPLEAC
ncbi:uncharacterized protein L3040_005581 [Drepanopeziza brunnea f. sp. 'multigermtubi']|uniref:uncharacterized protein n=1 Tax=Drepanopeziza brunnea f. sp. 'multigermtubi' TaxID=698441 RepID=UPI002396F580|nr:hypothetical protein L3040_005581 [Drepanopeziza brunnea f. sp. 'multigermtubi']